MKLYSWLEENNIEIEEIDIALKVYVQLMTSDTKASLKSNKYVYDYAENGPPENAHIFTYDDVGELEYVTNCTEENAFSVGTVAAAGFNFSIFEEKYIDDSTTLYYSGLDFEDALVIPVYTFSYNEQEIDALQLGVFHVNDYEIEDDMINFVCYDNAVLMDKKAKKIADIIKPQVTSKAFLTAILKYLNLSQGTVPDVKHFNIKKVTQLKKYTWRTIISYVLELLCAYGRFDDVGKFEYCLFDKSKSSGSGVQKIYYDNMYDSKKKGNLAIINGVEIVYGDYEGGNYSWTPDMDQEMQVPVPMSPDNPLLAGRTWTALDTIGERLTKRMIYFTFVPYEVYTFLPDFRIEAGDFVNVEDKNGNWHNILASQIKWTGNLDMEIISAWDGATYNLGGSTSDLIQRNDVKNSEMDSEEKKIYMDYTGEEFNSALKNLAENRTDADWSTSDWNITRIEFASNLPDDSTETISLSKENSENGVRAWFAGEKSTIYIYADADRIVLPKDFSYAFAGMKNITELDMSRFDTSNVTDMRYMFYDMENLAEINLSGFDTSKVTGMSGMFSECISLKELDLSDFRTENVTDMHAMFSGCSALTELDLSSFNTSNVTDMNWMFCGCSSLMLLDLSNFDTANVIDMSSMFMSCRALKELNLSDFNTSEVTSMHAMFSGCLALTELDLSSFRTGNVLRMSSMFSGCLALTELDLSSFDTSMVDTMNRMFTKTGLSKVNVSSFDTRGVANMLYMFAETKKLTEVDLTSFDTSYIATYAADNMFQNSALQYIYVSSKWTIGTWNQRNLLDGCSASIVVQQ